MKIETAVFGTGCFWCAEPIFSSLKGVISVTPGYAGGETLSPTYEDVCSGITGHAETVEILFDPALISYSDLLDVFWNIHDPTSLNRQDDDIGPQYRSIILYDGKKQLAQIEASIKRLEKEGLSKDLIVTEIKPLTEFYEAEDYHKNYYRDNRTQPYCQFVILPKLVDFSKKFNALQKK